MKAYGLKLYGGKYVGQPTLATLGDQLFWYDYRKAISLTSGNQIASIGDLGKNSLGLTPGVSNRLLDYEASGTWAGWGSETYLGNQELRTPYKSVLNSLHNGNAYGFYTVFKYDYTSGTNASFAIWNNASNNSLGKPGISFNVLADVGQFRRVASNGTTTQSRNTAASTLPENEYILVRNIFYGTSSTNALKTVIKNTSYALTAPSITPLNADAETSRSSQYPTALVKFRIKLITAYNFAGKTPSEIDLLDALIVSTIKADAEYASLIT